MRTIVLPSADMVDLSLFVCLKWVTDVQPDRRLGSRWVGMRGWSGNCGSRAPFKLLAKLQVGLNQIVLQQDFQSLG